MTAIDINQLTEEQKEALQKQFKAEEKAQREQKAQDKELLKKLEKDFVIDHIDFFIDERGILEDKILVMFANIESLIELRAKTYGNAKREQDSHTFTLDDGSASIKIGWNVRPVFNGTEAEGIYKIQQFIASLAGDSENEKMLMEIVNLALKRDVQGNYNPKKIRELDALRNKANSELFNEGMNIINEALKDVRTSRYVRGFKMVDNGDGDIRRVNFNFSID
ncbi:MAG: DUF3164 family protein [Flavobacteriaceae bacterium]|nr:DUF3164 family protein [Flavobacteriaceae bacterium]